MFVRPSAVRTSRNPGRRPIPPRMPVNEANRPLLRQFVRNRRSDPRYEAYILEVREGPAVNGNTNAAAGKSIPQPWVTVRDFVRANQSIGLPVSICDTLLKHLLTCVSLEVPGRVDSSEDSELACASPTSANDPQANSPARASGDANSPATGDVTSEENSPAKKSPRRLQPKVFQLSHLTPIRIVCEATGCILEVTARDPTAKRTASNPEESEQVAQVDPSRRWIISAPLANSTGEQTMDSSTAPGGKRRHPWETRGILELHESLMPQLSAFLTDVVTRYRSVNQLPEVRSLYSASGGRRFFFDLRDTRWGKRLHISQVTDLHRNVIGIPLEALVSFRARLDMIIRSLSLEDQHVLRSEIFGTTLDGASPRGQRQEDAGLRDGSNEAAESADGQSGGRKSTSMSNARNDGPGRQRGRRRQRIRSFTASNSGPGGGGGGGIAGAPGTRNNESARNGELSTASVEHTTESNPRRGGVNGPVPTGGGPNQWNGGAPRSRRFPRRNRIRTFNRTRRPPQEDTEHSGPTSQATAVQSAPEPAITSTRVAPVAEASA